MAVVSTTATPDEVAPSITPLKRPRSVSVLGATGSIGCSTADLLARNPDNFVVDALTGYRNVTLLAKQAIDLKAKFAVIADESLYAELKDLLAGTGVEAAAGELAVIEAAARPADILVAAIVGTAGLKPTLEGARRGALVALANKETLVSAGAIMTAEVHRGGATLIPVDSEHSAIFQVFDFERKEGVEKITLTASGGPFREKTMSQMKLMTPEQAVAHPNWDMGAKISVDSASMMNKGLEMIEAYHLFPVTESQINIVVHPQSVIHSLVTYQDGSMLAQLGAPDMRIPISYALGWPRRIKTPAKKLSLTELGRMDFIEPDPEKFPALRLTREALRRGGTAPTILNAANEVAVFAFLAGQIGFLDIAGIVEETLTQVEATTLTCLRMLHAIDDEARAVAQNVIGRM